MTSGVVTVQTWYVVLAIVALAGGLLAGGWRLAARITRLVDAVAENTRETRKARRHGRRQGRRINALEGRVESLERGSVRAGRPRPGNRAMPRR